MKQAGKTLSVEDLDVRRGDRTLFTGLSFGLESGQAALVTGPNGSGKTTLLRILAGLAPPAEGRVSWQGCKIGELPFERRGDIAYRGHLEGLKKDFTVRENLEFYSALWGQTADLSAVLEELELAAIAGLRMRYLSAGQKRRLALGTLKICGARLWILDEPMTNLDQDGRRLVVSWLEAHLEGGGLAVVASHLTDDLTARAAIGIEL